MAAFNNAIGMHLRLAFRAVARNSVCYHEKRYLFTIATVPVTSALIFNIKYNGIIHTALLIPMLLLYTVCARKSEGNASAI